MYLQYITDKSNNVIEHSLIVDGVYYKNPNFNIESNLLTIKGCLHELIEVDRIYYPQTTYITYEIRKVG